MAADCRRAVSGRPVAEAARGDDLAVDPAGSRRGPRLGNRRSRGRSPGVRTRTDVLIRSGRGLLGRGAIDLLASTAIGRGGCLSSQLIVPDDLGLDRQVVRLDDVDRDLSRVFELDRALVHVGPVGDGRARPDRPLGSHRLRQWTGGQDEDSLAAGRAAQGLISPGPLASQPVAQRADHAVILNLGDGGCPQPFEQAASPAKQIQEPPLPANPCGLHTAPRISQG